MTAEPQFGFGVFGWVLSYFSCQKSNSSNEMQIMLSIVLEMLVFFI